MGNFIGRILRLATFGESHGPGLGLILDGVPAGLDIDEAQLQVDLDRRKPGFSLYSSSRMEPDKIEILSGVEKGRTLGSPIAMLVRNKDAKASDYKGLINIFRPGHADYTYWKKYGIHPQIGGGRSSGRETLARVAGGFIAKSLLNSLNVKFYAYTLAIGKVKAKIVDRAFVEKNSLRVCDPKVYDLMVEELSFVKKRGDSVGGVIELVIENVPSGLGDPVFDKLDALLGGAMLSIGGVKGVEIGAGFESSTRYGSQNNDQMKDNGFLSNNSGGILGGISSGQPILLRLAIKPTPSIKKEQSTIDIFGRNKKISFEGRCDYCLCPRIVPVVEAMAALIIADAWLVNIALKKGFKI